MTGTESTSVPSPRTPLDRVAGAAATRSHANVETPAVFSTVHDELQALTGAAGVFDLGWLTRFRITGEDRVRWLNGMVTNTIRDLAPGTWNISFLLNAQGRIQGDGATYAFADHLEFATDAAQSIKLREHLDRFIIMDDVELADVSSTALGIAGPQAADLLAGLGYPLPEPGGLVETAEVVLVRQSSESFILWIAPETIETAWKKLLAAGAVPCGIDAVEALRVLRGVPRYGADIHEKSLPQETGQMHALNFNKGCYLGQEIVERIRSRANLNRQLRAFHLEGTFCSLPSPLTSNGTEVGELTSVTEANLPGVQGIFALGTVRSEAANVPLGYSGGTATALDRAPLATR